MAGLARPGTGSQPPKRMHMGVFRVLSGILLVLALLLHNDATASFKKTKIAVLDFEQRGESGKNKDMGGIVAEWFTTAMVKDGRFEVVERALLKKIIEEQKLGMSGLIDQNSTAQLGKILGVKTIISGSVMLLQDHIEVNARIINVNTGSIVAAENLRSESSANLKEAIEHLTAKIVKNFPLTGYIVKKRDDTVLIDLGTSAGLQPGMEFIVFKEGEAIKHPKTGEVLDVEQIRTGKIKIVEIALNTATGEIIEQEPKQEIRYGQLVQSMRRTEPVTEEPPAGTATTAARPHESSTKATASSPPASAEAERKATFTSQVASEAGYKRSEFPPGQRDQLASGGQGPALLPLPTGTFMMGSERFSEKPPHFVKIENPVHMTVTEITFEEYEKFSIESGAPMPSDNGWGRKDRPVINVSWHDAQAYARWLSKQTGVTYRLPSESEWEWACGAGTGTLYPWGNDFKPGMANCRSCQPGTEAKQTVPTRSYPANSSGFHDMAGNVWEWVEDCWVDHYRDASQDQSPRKVSGKCSNFTIRGGGWNSPDKQLSTTSRLGILGDTRSNYIGFRLVKDPHTPLRADEPAAQLLPTTAPAITPQPVPPLKQEETKPEPKTTSPFESQR